MMSDADGAGGCEVTRGRFEEGAAVLRKHAFHTDRTESHFSALASISSIQRRERRRSTFRIQTVIFLLGRLVNTWVIIHVEILITCAGKSSLSLLPKLQRNHER